MEWIKPGTKIDFMAKKEWALLGSGLLILAGLLSILLRGGLNYGIDFTGGTLVQLRFERPVPLEEVRHGLRTIRLGDSLLQQFGGDSREILIRFGSTSQALQDPAKEIVQTLQQRLPGRKIEVRRVETVGPQISHVLQRKALIAVLVSFVGIFLYVSYRFGIAWAAGGILALIHDVMVTVGVFSLANKEISLPVVAALLTIIGYSINDTIVVFDRIREKFRKQSKGEFHQIINTSINETLSRTI
ncbi:MAG: protein translocase subunit SecF, partial [Candidatus Tectomicrobia bacterium]|nr:protein translocase subunit SecF [Candidatus Tectomicrobia bacterium]